MILIRSDALILEHSDSDFDVDDWGNEIVPSVSLFVRHLPLYTSWRSTCRSCR